MTNYVEVNVIVEGPTEKSFIDKILSSHLAERNIGINARLLGVPGHKGGNVNFDRVFKDINILLKQRNDTYVSTMIDFYRIRQDWPGYNEASQKKTPDDIAAHLKEATLKSVVEKIEDKHRPSQRFIPYFSIHEFEALLFSDMELLAKHLNVTTEAIKREIGLKLPEEINDGIETYPVARIEKVLGHGFRKTTKGIFIAQEIGIEKMREKCPVFHRWLAKLESLKPL